MKQFLLLILAFGLMTACATSPTGRSQLMLVSPQSAIVESKKAYISTVGELGKEDKLLNDPALSKRVATITGRLVTIAVQKFPASATWEWSVAIVDDPEVVNAWCMAGGRMAVYTGLFKKLRLTDAEFAQIMGHEISHALANHTAERMSRAMATTLGVVAVGVMSDKPGIAMGGAAMAAKVALDLPNSRTAEK
jgi:Zn-dependent protease with chaperone function